ncbi:hypothetical protein R1flu_023386 [Riccia fluitans]|uniref:Ubiquitin-related modifier 1 n=1 Tax=Riccia fluitans TaxID=41844 RepID=A0ABD1XRW4_9MARC
MGSLMISCLAYLVFAYGIPMELVINSEETGVQLLPAGNLHSFRLKGCREVSIQGQGDKRMITVMVLSNAEGEMLPGQVIFEGSTSRSHPHCSEARALTSRGWNLTQSESHWTTLETLQEFVEKLLPADVVMMRPFKCAIQRNFAQWAVGEIASKLEHGIKADNAQLENRFYTLDNGSGLTTFRGGLELLFSSVKIHEVDIPPPEGQTKLTVRYLLFWIRDNLLKERPEIFLKEKSV